MIFYSILLAIVKINIITRRNMILIFLYTGIIHYTSITSEIGIYNGLWLINNNIMIISIIIIFISSTVLLIENDKKEEKWILMLINILSMISVMSANDLISLFLSIELQSYSLYILATLPNNLGLLESGRSAGLKYFLLGSLASGFILLGSSLIYGLSGFTQLESLLIINDNLNIIGEIFIIIGLLLKIAASPFHNWAPDVYDGVPTLITSWIAIFPKIALIICLNGLITTIFNDIIILKLLGLISIASLLIGSILGLVQYRIKRLLAYSGIAHVGFLILCIITNDSNSLIYYLIQYAFTTVTIFYIIASLNAERISELKNNNNNLLVISLAACLLSLAGIPPFIGFIAKFQTLLSTIDQGYYLITFIALLSSAIGCANYLRVIKVIHFDNENLKYNYKIKLSNKISYIISLTTLLIILFISI